MELSPSIQIKGLSLWFSEINYLCISDLHLGYEEALNKQGYMVPRQQFKEIYRSVSILLKTLHPKTIVINGDLKHEFGNISRQEWKDVLAFIDLCEKYCEHVVLIKGNHDTILGPLANRKNLIIEDFHIKGKLLFTHGDKIPDESTLRGIKIIIIGHEHPALELRDGGRKESFKCHLDGRWRGRRLMVMPSFNPLTHGTNVLSAKHITPFLEKGVASFDVYVVDDKEKVLSFGKVRDLR